MIERDCKDASSTTPASISVQDRDAVPADVHLGRDVAVDTVERNLPSEERTLNYEPFVIGVQPESPIQHICYQGNDTRDAEQDGDLKRRQPFV